jgi:hypothetical protein
MAAGRECRNVALSSSSVKNKKEPFFFFLTTHAAFG